jgi:hypothetical protein
VDIARSDSGALIGHRYGWGGGEDEHGGDCDEIDLDR